MTSLATWLTHADTSVTRRALGAVELVDGVGHGRRRGVLALGDRGEMLAADAARGGAARRRPRAWASSSSVVGWRWAMPRMARSGSTWRTGVSVAAASRSRHAATAWATARARGRSERASFSLSPRHARGRSPRSAGGAAPRTRPRPSSSRPSAPQLGDQAVVQLEQDATSAAAYSHWASVSGRRSQSVSRSPLAGDDAELALQQRRQRRRAVADEAGGDLGVEQPRRDRPDGVGQHVEVLLGGVGDGEGRAGEQPASGAGSTASGSTSTSPSGQASWTRASRGKYVRSRWNSVSRA